MKDRICIAFVLLGFILIGHNTSSAQQLEITAQTSFFDGLGDGGQYSYPTGLGDGGNRSLFIDGLGGGDAYTYSIEGLGEGT